MKIEDFDALPFFSVNRAESAVEPITLESVKRGFDAFEETMRAIREKAQAAAESIGRNLERIIPVSPEQKRGIDFAVGIDQTHTYSWKVTKIRADFGPRFLIRGCDDRRPLKRRQPGSAAHRRYLRRLVQGGAK